MEEAEAEEGPDGLLVAIANSCEAPLFARDAKFGEAEQAAFGIVWTEDLFAQADEDNRFTIDGDAFVAAQRAWVDANMPKNGEIVQVDEYGAAKLPKGATRVWGGKPGKKDRVALSVDPRNGAVSEVYFTPPAPLRRRRRPAPAPAKMLRPLSLRPVPTSPRRAAR